MPSGASTGIYEALELRDGDNADYLGKSVHKAVKHINEVIAPQLIAKKFAVTQQKEIDDFMVRELDGTDNKNKLGANAILGVSLAVCKAGAAEKGIPLYRYISELSGRKIIMPVPAFNVINGGSHAGNKLAMQVSFTDLMVTLVTVTVPFWSSFRSSCCCPPERIALRRLSRWVLSAITT